MFKTLDVSIPSQKISAGGYKQISLNYTVPVGYRAIGIAGYYLSGSVQLNAIVLTTTYITVGNIAEYETTANGFVTLLLAKKY